THLAAHMVERELEGIAHVVADRGNRTAECTDEANFYGFLLGCRRGRCKQQRCSPSQKSFAHMRSSQRALGPVRFDILIYRHRCQKVYRCMVHDPIRRTVNRIAPLFLSIPYPTTAIDRRAPAPAV